MNARSLPGMPVPNCWLRYDPGPGSAISTLTIATSFVATLFSPSTLYLAVIVTNSATPFLNAITALDVVAPDTTVALVLFVVHEILVATVPESGALSVYVY